MTGVFNHVILAISGMYNLYISMIIRAWVCKVLLSTSLSPQYALFIFYFHIQVMDLQLKNFLVILFVDNFNDQ